MSCSLVTSTIVMCLLFISRWSMQRAELQYLSPHHARYFALARHRQTSGVQTVVGPSRHALRSGRCLCVRVTWFEAAFLPIAVCVQCPGRVATLSSAWFFDSRFTNIMWREATHSCNVWSCGSLEILRPIISMSVAVVTDVERSQLMKLAEKT